MEDVAFVGLGNMGSALATNLIEAGFEVLTYDAAGSNRCPAGAAFTEIPELACRAEVVVLSLPDAAASDQVVERILATENRSVQTIVDTSTIGVEAARSIHKICSDAGVSYVDAPVSGGVAGAQNRTLSVMYSGSSEACTRITRVLEGLSDRRRRVGEVPGLAQALKLANNFLTATALAAASEAIRFGTAAGLDMGTMLEVINSSSGQSAATADKFENHVRTRRYSSGFTNSLMAKDVRLYLQSVESQQLPATLGTVTTALWERFAVDEPGVDFTRIYPFVAGGSEPGS